MSNWSTSRYLIIYSFFIHDSSIRILMSFLPFSTYTLPCIIRRPIKRVMNRMEDGLSILLIAFVTKIMNNFEVPEPEVT